MWIADLHIHSKYSRATSADCDAPHLDLWARYKGVGLVGTGDFTHPKWRQELSECLIPEGNGFYRLKDDCALDCRVPEAEAPRFVVSGEISTIYKRDGRTRKVHHVILLPGLEEAEELAHRLEAIGNLHSDGRPILGLDSRDLLEITLESCPEAIYIPAHIWTPHFSLFGAFSGFDSLAECYGDLSPLIKTVETGLSSDPPMNRRLSLLDNCQLVSNSDAHSPAKLGREGNLLTCEKTYADLKRALETGDGLAGTIEFFPEEGKYHLDGHRACGCRLEPQETAALGGRCPKCGRKITVGVLSRVEALADRPEPQTLPKPFESLIPLKELLAECIGCSPAAKKAEDAYFHCLEKLGPEFAVLRQRAPEDVEAALGSPLLAEALRRLRAGKVIREAGYDGEYGVIRVFNPGERETLQGQISLLTGLPMSPSTSRKKPGASADAPDQKQPKAADAPDTPAAETLNEAQQRAVESTAAVTAVIAGPGTGKTRTLIARILYLIEKRGVKPGEITAVTFTRQAAAEMSARLEAALGKRAAKAVTVGTFHAICLSLLPEKPLINREQAKDLMTGLLADRGEKMPPSQALALVSARKNGLPAPGLNEGVAAAYQALLESQNLRDLDDLLLEAMQQDASGDKRFSHLLVDEYQDLNAVQRALAAHWSAGRELFVIGDPDQSIYGFRGADAGCFDALLAAHPGAAVLRLTENYRSTPEILASATAVIEKNPGGARPLLAKRAPGAAVRVVDCGGDEPGAVAREIVRMAGGMDMLSAAEGERERAVRPFSEIAVLCRTHRQLERMEAALRRESVPCVVFGRGDEWEDAKVQGLTGFFEALCQRSAPALDCALKNLWRCPTTLRAKAEEAFLSAENADDESWLTALSSFDGLSPFVAAVQEALPGLRRDKPRKLLDALAQNTGCKGAAVTALLNTAVFFPSMPDFLDALRLGEEGDIRRLSGGRASGAVRLMTLHAAKGLEFPAVILAGVGDGELPLLRPDEPLDIEQERRLFFVGLTRAKEELILTHGGAPSPFLAELPASVCRERAAVRPWPARQISFF